jgi:hydroxyacyl-ACP dehydratase HTD2-like protein with hotdog domain
VNPAAGCRGADVAEVQRIKGASFRLRLRTDRCECGQRRDREQDSSTHAGNLVMMNGRGIVSQRHLARRHAEVGQTAQRSRTVEPDDIVRFTDISGDRNPLHYDLEAARATPFGEIIVQGGVTSAILNAVVAEDLPGPGSVFSPRQLELQSACTAG